MKHLLLLLSLCLLAGFARSQALAINGTVSVDNASVEGSILSITRNDEPFREITLDRRGRFELKFPFDAEYVLTFKKTGYISKIVNINTEAPEEIIESNPDFKPIKLIIHLLPTVENIDLSIFEQPVAILSYDPELDDFYFNKEYSQTVGVRIKETENSIKKILSQRGKEIMERDNKFNDLTTQGETAYSAKKWKEAINFWNQALAIKRDDEHVKTRIADAQREMTAEEEAVRKAAEEAEKAKQEAKRRDELMGRYREIIALADKAFDNLNYSIARAHYVDADALQTGEAYPQERIKEIDQIINSSKYKKQLEDYNSNIALAEKEMKAKNYAGAKVYYTDALQALPMNKDEVNRKIEEINKLIEAENLAAIEKEYKENIEKADKNYNEKAYAVARFYYQKALEVKKGDAYAQKRLSEMESMINDRTEKTIEL
ncbi:MAG: hypothetical protein LBM07_05975 [Culturomica sp.]|jgi:hypothetical protein|nr:hypothetical protein [Culturomica sp.]